MARNPWSFAGYSWPTNPDEDSGWITEPIYSEQNAISANVSRFQFTALKSSRRQVSGYFYGPLALQQRDTFEGWLRGRTQATLVDHLGTSRKAFLIRFDAHPVIDVRAHREGRATFRFSAEFAAVD